jgi:DNA-binding protein H-NS
MTNSTVDQLQRELHALDVEYKTRRSAIEKRIAETQKNEHAEALAQIQKLMDQYKIEPDDLRLSGRRRLGKPTKKVVAKFRGPNGEIWSGRGRQPLWVGQDREKFRIKD